MSKFNFKKVSGKKAYKAWAKWEHGDFIVGKFLQSTPGYKKSEEKRNYEFELLETSFDDVKVGETFVLNHNGLLAYHMDSRVNEGDIVKVEYTGMEAMEDGSMAHQVEVYVAEGDDKVTTEIPEADESEEDYGL